MKLLEGFVDISALLGSGVYALCYRGEVVYVGKAKQLLKRIYSHRNLLERARSGRAMPSSGPYSRSRAIFFNKVLIQPCTEIDLDRTEIALIAKLRPKHNSNHQPSEKVSIADLGFDLIVNGINLSIVQTPPKGLISRRI